MKKNHISSHLLYFNLFIIDDVFFQPDWVGACWGRWAGPGLMLGWSAGSWMWLFSGRIAAMLVCKLRMWHSSAKNKKEGGSARASPVAAPMPKSASF